MSVKAWQSAAVSDPDAQPMIPSVCRKKVSHPSRYSARLLFAELGEITFDSATPAPGDMAQDCTPVLVVRVKLPESPGDPETLIGLTAASVAFVNVRSENASVRKFVRLV